MPKIVQYNRKYEQFYKLVTNLKNTVDRFLLGPLCDF